MIEIKSACGGVEFEVKVVPGSSRTAVAGEYGAKLRVNVAAPPEKGKANKMLVEFLAEALAVRRNDITIVRGETTPIKRIRVAGISAESLRKAFAKFSI